MRYYTHMISSFVGAYALSETVDMPIGLAFTCGLLLGSVLPDIDEPNSLIGRKTSIRVKKSKKEIKRDKKKGKEGEFKRVGISTVINKLFGHRGFTHSLPAVMLLSLLLLLSHHSFVVGVIWGYFLHIAGDFFSKTGVPLFKPVINRKFKIHIYTTGKRSEDILLGFIIGALVLIADKHILDWFMWS